MKTEKIIKKAEKHESVSLNLRTTAEIRDRFKELCKKTGSTANRTLNAFMEEYIKKEEQKNVKDLSVFDGIRDLSSRGETYRFKRIADGYTVYKLNGYSFNKIGVVKAKEDISDIDLFNLGWEVDR